MTTMLQLGQKVMGELGLDVPIAIASSTDKNLIQLLALMNAAGDELLHIPDVGWEAATTEYRFTVSHSTMAGITTNGSPIITGISSTASLAASTWMVTGSGIPQDTYILSVDSATQVTLTQSATQTSTGSVTLNFCKTKYALPADYDYLINKTQWDKSMHWEMLGPETSQQWQWLKSGYIATGPRIRYRLLGGTFQIWPPVSTDEYLGFEYHSLYWARNSGGTAISGFSADTDTCIYPTRLFVLFTKVKFWEAKGFDTTALYRDYLMELSSCISRDTASPTLSFAPRPSEVLISWDNIPDSGYGR